MSLSDLTCEEIIEEILKGGVYRERIIPKIYRQIKGYVYKIANELSLSHDVVEEYFREAVAEFVHKVETGKFTQQSNRACFNFIYRVCYNKSVDHIRRLGRKKPEIPLNPEMDIEAEEEPISLFEYEEIAKCWDQLSDTCKQVLSLYREGYSAEEIVKMANLKNANSVGVTKFACIKKLRDCIEKLRNDEFFV